MISVSEDQTKGERKLQEDKSVNEKIESKTLRETKGVKKIGRGIKRYG